MYVLNIRIEEEWGEDVIRIILSEGWVIYVSKHKKGEGMGRGEGQGWVCLIKEASLK